MALFAFDGGGEIRKATQRYSTDGRERQRWQLSCPTRCVPYQKWLEHPMKNMSKNIIENT